MKRSLLGLAIAGSMLIAAQTANAVVIVYTANLNGPSENPANASPGTGVATVKVDDVANTMVIGVTFSGLLGTTTAAHIHCCIAAPGNIIPATRTPTLAGFPAGVTAGGFLTTLDMTDAASFNPAFVTANTDVAGARAALFAGLLAGQSYFNIHTNTFGGGEIRGFLTAVPEPATLSLLGFGLAGLGWIRRKRGAA